MNCTQELLGYFMQSELISPFSATNCYTNILSVTLKESIKKSLLPPQVLDI